MSPEFLEPLPAPVSAPSSAEPDFGRLLGDSWNLVRENSGPLLKTWAAAGLPALVLGLAASSALDISDKESAVEAVKSGRVLSFGLWFGAMLAARAIDALALGACVLAADDALSGKPCDPGAAWRRLGSRLLPWASTGVVRVLWLVVGYALLIVPGILLTIRWTLWSYAVLVEGRSGGDALARSRQIVAANLIPVLCAAWGSAAIAAAVEYFSSMVTGIVPYLLALVAGLATGVGVEEASLPLIVVFALLDLLIGAAASVWAAVVVLFAWRGLAPRHPEPPERGYLV